MTDQPKMDFSNLDGVMMLLIFGASTLVDKSAPVHEQAQKLAAFQAEFMDMRCEHEEKHTEKFDRACPCCNGMRLALLLARPEA